MTERQAQVLWFTGLSGAGKTTAALQLIHRMRADNIPVCLLDGDELRARIHRELGFSREDRREHIRRTAELASLLAQNHIHVVVALISPLREDRTMARKVIGTERFFEVFVDTPLQTCMQRDPKGLYAKAHKRQISDMTGFDSIYEPPLKPEFRINHQVELELQIKQILDRFALTQGQDLADGPHFQEFMHHD